MRSSYIPLPMASQPLRSAGTVLCIRLHVVMSEREECVGGSVAAISGLVVGRLGDVNHRERVHICFFFPDACGFPKTYRHDVSSHISQSKFLFYDGEAGLSSLFCYPGHVLPSVKCLPLPVIKCNVRKLRTSQQSLHTAG